MPELPEVEAVVQRLRRAAPWEEIVECGQFRTTTAREIKKAIGLKLEGADRRGKHIILRLNGGAFLRVHLKMTGNLEVIPDARKRDTTVRAWLRLADGRGIVLDDPRALGRVSFHSQAEEAELFGDLGPEPFSAEFTAEHLINWAKRTVKAVKLVLMEQRAVVGLGNIYAAEALFQAGIHPAKPARRVSTAKLRELREAILAVLGAAISSAEAAYERPGRFTEGEQYEAAVYGREGEPCRRCRGTIRRITQGGRSTYYCPKCQK